MAEEKHEQPHVPAPAKGAKIPVAATAVGAGYAPRAAGEDDASAEANSRIAADIASRANPPIPANQLVTEPTGMDGSRAMYIIVGPYRGQILTMPDAEAEDAKDSHWAVEMDKVAPPFDADTPFDHDHELTDEDRSYAIEAADAWAQAQYNPEEPAVEGEDETARAAREKRNADRQAQRKPERKNETDEQRQAREKRNSDHNERQMKPRPASNKANPAGTYETR